MEFKYLIPLVPFAMFIYYLWKWRSIDILTDGWVYGDNEHDQNRYSDNADKYDLLTSRWKEKTFTWFAITTTVVMLVVLL